MYGIVQGGVEPDLRTESVEAVSASGSDGIAIGGSLGQDKQQMHEVVAWSTAELERTAPDRPRHLLGIGEIDDLIAGVELGVDTFDCAMPTRLGRHGVALIPDPDNRWRVDLVKSGVAIAVRRGANRPDISTEAAVQASTTRLITTACSRRPARPPRAALTIAFTALPPCRSWPGGVPLSQRQHCRPRSR